jgi:hypothetical protein
VLWDRRFIVALGIVVAVAAGLLVRHQSQAQGTAAGSGFGSVQLVLDTTDSQLVEGAPKGADSLPTRAGLLADALATEAGRVSVARSAGVTMEELAILGPAAMRAPIVETPLVRRVAAAASTAHTRDVVHVWTDDVTPIISIEAQAPTGAATARLARATAAGLRSLLNSEDGTHSNGFVLKTIAPLTIKHLATSSNASLRALGAAVVTFVLWCVGVVVLAGTAARMRRPNRVPQA